MAKIRLIKLIPAVLALSVLFSGCAELEKLKSQLADDSRPDYSNTVTVLDVGQAACTLIESEGQFCLIDAGYAGGTTDGSCNGYESVDDGAADDADANDGTAS